MLVKSQAAALVKESVHCYFLFFPNERCHEPTWYLKYMPESPQNTVLQRVSMTHTSETTAIVFKSVVWHVCLKGKFVQLIWQPEDDI